MRVIDRSIRHLRDETGYFPGSFFAVIDFLRHTLLPKPKEISVITGRVKMAGLSGERSTSNPKSSEYVPAL